MRPHCGGAADGVGTGKSTVAVVAAGFVVRAEGYLEGMVRIPRAPSDHGMVRIPRPPSDHGMVRPSVPPAGNAGRWIGLWFLQLLFQAESRVIQAMLVNQVDVNWPWPAKAWLCVTLHCMLQQYYFNISAQCVRTDIQLNQNLWIFKYYPHIKIFFVSIKISLRLFSKFHFVFGNHSPFILIHTINIYFAYEDSVILDMEK